MKQLLLIAFFFEIGFVLTVVPWSPFWDRNYFVQLPFVRELFLNNFFRGGITGLGVVNIVAGMAELVSLLVSRHVDSPESVTRSRPAEK
jgi:hypothetical protein